MREENQGLNWNQPAAKKPAAPANQNKPAWQQQQQQESEKASSYGMNDNYEDDFDEIEEDLPVDEVHLDNDQIGIQNSGQGITVSQSLGVDPSVDSLALEDYDHVEPVERLM